VVRTVDPGRPFGEHARIDAMALREGPTGAKEGFDDAARQLPALREDDVHDQWMGGSRSLSELRQAPRPVEGRSRRAESGLDSRSP
jgi:hypothetical protein